MHSAVVAAPGVEVVVGEVAVTDVAAAKVAKVEVAEKAVATRWWGGGDAI